MAEEENDPKSSPNGDMSSDDHTSAAATSTSRNGADTPPALRDDEEEKEQTLAQNLCQGFLYLRQRRRDGIVKDASNGMMIQPPSCVLPSFLSHVTVNFIDPTASSITTTATTSSSSSSNNGTATNIIYDKFAAIFERDYACTLTYVPYQLFRNNSSGVVESLPVKMVLTKSHGGGLVVLQDDVPANATAASDETFDEPYCHVYLAACESLEHYRTKVKPSIQAFVSQLESAHKASNRQGVGYRMVRTGSDIGEPSTPGARTKRNIAPRYVIVFVPTGDKIKAADVATQSPKKGHHRAGGVGSRFAGLGQRLRGSGVGVEQPPMAVDSTHSGTTSRDSGENNNGGGEQEGSDHGSKHPASQTLTKIERELLKKFKHDFPSGNVCTLSTLCVNNSSRKNLDDGLDDASEREEIVEKLEWNAVMKSLGSAIMAGFQDRCHRYDEELRKLDTQRRGEGGGSAPDTGDESNNEGFHLNHFFLVKESLAFTYEQMRLPAEAHLQYKELRAFLPESPAISSENIMNEEFVRVALAGDCLDFRRSIRACEDFGPISQVVEQYLFAREVALLFQMHKSIRVVLRCLSYAKSVFDAREKEIVGSSEESQQQMIALQKWAFNFCWDVKIASDLYFKTTVSTKTSVDEYFSRALCDLLEFSRLRLMKLGNLLLPGGLSHIGSHNLVHTIQSPWEAWTEPSVSTMNGDSAFDNIDSDAQFLDDALSSADSFIARYLQLTKVLAEYNEFCGRHRYAARLRIERMVLYDRKKDAAMAVKELLSIVDIYNQDFWSACHFALLFRLAAFQRELSKPPDYLDTLVRCFSETLSKTAPAKAMGALQTDLEMVVKSPSVDGATFAAAPLFGPIFGLEGIASPRVLGTDRNLLKRLYTVGDTVRVTLALKSFLPNRIEVDSISVALVPFRAYVAAMEDHLPITESDVFRELTVEKPAEIRPGQNEYTIDWLPKATGQFIMSSATISWNGVKFTYTAKELRRPTIRIDVVPCEPTQKLDVQPDFLLPGHEQPVTFKFSSGTDVVEKGILQLVGSPGLFLQPPNAEAGSSTWVSSLEAPLPSCPPLQTVSMTSKIKVVSADESSASLQPLQVTISTSYKYANDEPDSAKAECMETSLTAKIPTLGKPALSVLASDFVQHSADNSIVNVVLQCNTPVPFTINGWSIDLPHKLSLSDLGDLNESLVNEKVVAGDRISFSFECSSNDTDSSSGRKEPLLHVDLTNEDGANFRETLRLNIARPAAQRTKPLDRKAIAVEISSSANEGLAGVPVVLTYTIDMDEVVDLSGTVLYKVDFDAREWIVSGKLEGRVHDKIDVMAIPVRIGRIVDFPAIQLFHRSDTGSLSLPVAIDSPTHFTSLSPTSHMSVAFPIGSARKLSSKASI